MESRNDNQTESRSLLSPRRMAYNFIMNLGAISLLVSPPLVVAVGATPVPSFQGFSITQQPFNATEPYNVTQSYNMTQQLCSGDVGPLSDRENNLIRNGIGYMCNQYNNIQSIENRSDAAMTVCNGGVWLLNSAIQNAMGAICNKLFGYFIYNKISCATDNNNVYGNDVISLCRVNNGGLHPDLLYATKVGLLDACKRESNMVSENLCNGRLHSPISTEMNSAVASLCKATGYAVNC